MREVRVALLPSEVDWQHRGTAVVIDVLRATTVINQAIASGAAEVVVCAEIDEALRLADQTEPRPLLCGERSCRLIPGFDLANSPSEYRPERVAGKRLVMTTTNGTRAAVAAADFDQLYAVSFNNLSAVAEALADETAISILCAGTDGDITDDDVLWAGALLERLGAAASSPAAEQAIALWREHVSRNESLSDRLAVSRGGQGLLRAGFQADIAHCAQIDSLRCVAVASCRDPITFTWLRSMPASEEVVRF